jgi:hypothetical protein
MSDAAIKAALEAAGEAVCRYGDGLRCDPEPDCEMCRGQAAAAVAAFLRAMPPHYVEASPDGGIVCITGSNLAAAVERAARGEDA